MRIAQVTSNSTGPSYTRLIDSDVNTFAEFNLLKCIRSARNL
jgi:hypothetical protein